MKIAFNPSTVAALIAPPNNKDITFDLRGHNIFARGVKFCGTDTNTWRDIKINNVSIDSNILDLRDGSNTTLTNINGVVTINSTWRPVVDNLTSDSTTSSLSANQGRVLKALIDGKSDSEHTHDDRYVKKTGDTMLGALNFANGTWNLVGDDSYMGDCNISGHFGIKAANTTYPGISFFNNANAHLGNLTAYSGNIKYGAYSLQFLDNGNTNVSAGTWMNPFNTYNASAVADGQAICVWGQSSQLSNLAADSGDMSLWLKRVNSNVATLNMVLDGEYYANGNQRLAHVSEIPNSLKNPYALTISLNGTSQGPYDGSAAKNINITPSSIGAATSDHNHDGRYLKLTGGVLKGQIILPDIDVNTSYTGSIIIGASNTENLGIDGNEIMARNNGKASTLYLNNEGGAVQLGAILRTNSNIAYIGSQSTQNMIKFINNTSDPYGNGIAIGGGGLTIIGSGESSDVVMNQHSSGGDENMIIAGDNNIDFYSNLQDGWQYGKHMYLDTNGFLFTPSYINIGGNENNNSSPDRVWGSNGSDSYLRSYRTSALRVAYASSTGNADLLDGYHYNDFTYKKYISYNRNGPYNMKIFSKDISSITWGASYLIFDIFSSGYNSNRVYFGKYEVSLGHWNNTDKNPTVYSRWIFKTNSAYDCVHVIKDLSNYTVDVYIENNLWDCSMGLSIIAIDGFKMVPSSSWVNLPSASGTVQLIGTTYLSFMGNADMLDGYHASGLFTALSNSDNGISITVGGTTKSVSNISVNYASSAGNADTVDGYHASSLVKFYLSPMTNDAPADSAKSWFINTMPSASGAIVYNVPGSEKTIIAGKSSGAYGHMLQLNYDNTYLRVLRYYNGSWKSTDWEKISAGYADSAGSASKVYGQVGDTGSHELVRCDMNNDQFRIIAGSSGNNNGWAEIATADDGNEPIYVRQYTGVFSSVRRTLTLLDGSGNTTFPGSLSIGGQIIREGSGQTWVNGRNGALLRETSVAGYHTLWSLKTTNGSWDFGEYNAGNYWDNIPVLSYITDSNYNSGNNTPTYQIRFPLASGTVALTSNIPNPTNYYWANVKISASSSTTTSPTVHTLTATRVCAGHNPEIDNSISCSNWFRSSGDTGWYNTTYQGGWYMSDTSWIRAHNGVGIYTSGQIYSSSSIKMGNILLEHTDEINNSTNGGIHLNYRNSGNITLCYGGGNVGIGTPSPTYKLDVNGQVRASGFRHSSVNSDNYMLLAGGGYKSFGGDDSHPIFLGYLNLDHGNNGTISSSFYCLGYSVPFTYTRGGNYCRISIPDTSYQVFYIRAAIASVNYSGGGMDTWTGYRRGAGAWWLHCYVSSLNEVRVKGFRQANDNNDSWWGGNPLVSDNSGANRITVCIFGNVTFR